MTINIHDVTCRKEKKCETERERTNKKVFIWSHGSQTSWSRDKRRNFWPHFQVTFFFFCARFRIHQLVFALRHKESGSGLCLKLYLLRKQGLLLRFTSKRSLRDKERLTHKWKICNFRILGFFANLTCLNVSVSDFLFFHKESPNFSKSFFCVVPKSILIFFFLFGSLETTLFGL